MCMMRIPRHAGRLRIVGRSCSKRVGQFEFPSAVETDPVCAAFNREHTAEVAVPAAKDKLENGLEQFHTSCAR
jgi:hypothetical protein